MLLPIKIEPDNLKQAIVHLKFDVNIPFELIPGKILDALEKFDYIYIPAPRPMVSIPMGNPNQKLEFANSGSGIFHNKKIKFQIKDSGIVFTMFASYIGWKQYFQYISEVLTEIRASNIIASYKNIGLRYISEYINEPIENKIRSQFSWNITNKSFPSSASVYKTEFKEGERKIVINLANHLERINQPTKAVERVSVVDIDVICPLQNLSDHESVLKEIEISHNIEKEYFFGLLTKEFINSINPTY